MAGSPDRDGAGQVRGMFDRIARRYDLMNTLMTWGRDQAWRREAARLTRPEAGGLALDVATGTGDLARALLDETPVRAVVGVDFSETMLALGRAKARRLGLEDRLHFVVVDALALPFPDWTFACVTSAFLLRNLASPAEGLEEMVRVTRPGGRVVALETSNPSLPGFRQLFTLYFRHFVPLLGRLVSGDPDAYRYLPRTAAGFLGPEDLAREMSAAGLRHVTYRRLALGTVAIHVGTV
jgi:demethylmenaquinone methyltransferase/2-methoxy-6-polyprenyl-1,4-benzoquinol methylase